VQQVIADLRYHWPSQVEICVAADLLETQQAMLAEKDETIAELREEIDRCHARLEIDHVFTGGGKQEDGGFLRVEVPMGERKSLPDAVACRDDTIELQGEQIAELHARCEAAESDAERLRQFERWADDGFCPHLVFDDDGHWAVSFAGSGPCAQSDEITSHVAVVEPHEWSDSVGEAIDAALATQHAAQRKEGGL
jgi:hypothetical protein